MAIRQRKRGVEKEESAKIFNCNCYLIQNLVETDDDLSEEAKDNLN